MGAYRAEFWNAPEFWHADDLALGMEEHPSVWTDGSREEYPTDGFEVAGAGENLLPLAGCWLEYG